MTKVRIKVGPRQYSIACGPGDEEKVARFGKLIDENYAKLGTARAAQESENVVFAALFMADELDEARTALGDARTELAELHRELQAARDDLANATRHASERSEEDKARAGGKKAELRAEIETLRKAEERARMDNAALKAEIAALEEQARHQHDLFGGPAEDAALSEALAEKLEALAARAEKTASELEGRAEPS
ncbi:cell division protein ZapA [Qipengyuania nanhaisediminis]|uniref:cell division protein ZapA n=1 Tax=Qipengyuania nanhaisediminis TaxID=604088 RepID=UPI0038B2C3C8